jgi:hypothetical protein
MRYGDGQRRHVPLRGGGDGMILISRVRRNGTVDLMVVLDEDSVERIKRYDPAEIPWMEMPPDIRMRRPATIAVAYATAAEQKQIEQWSVSEPDWKDKAIDMLSRGFEYRPDLGDHDFGTIEPGKPTEGPKQ